MYLSPLRRVLSSGYVVKRVPGADVEGLVVVDIKRYRRIQICVRVSHYLMPNMWFGG